MTGDKSGDNNSNAPKKGKKSSRTLWKEPVPAVSRDRSPSPYLPSRCTPLTNPPRAAPSTYPPRGSPLPYDSGMIGMGYSQQPLFPTSLNPYVPPRQAFTEAPPQTPTMMSTPGYDTPQGFSQLPPRSQQAACSGTPTATPSPTVSHHSSASVTNDLPEGGVAAPQLESYDSMGRLIIEPVGYSFLPGSASRILSRIIQGCFTDSPSWGKMSPDLKRQIYLSFKSKCSWLPEHEAHVAQNFEKKAAQLLKGALERVRTEQAKPDWIRPEPYKKLLQYWASDEFKKLSEIGKKARNSTKGGSLHTCGAKSQAAVIKEMELKQGRILPQDEAFKITHVKKKKNSDGQEVWVEDRARLSYNQFQQSFAELCHTLPLGTEPTDEQRVELWKESVGGPTRFGTVYGMSNRAFRHFQSPLQGIGSSTDLGSLDRANVMAMEQKITELSSQLQASEARDRQREEQLRAAEDREKRRDAQFAGMQAQLNSLLASVGIPACPGDTRRFEGQPSHSQSRTRHREVDQAHRLVDEPSSDDDGDGEHVSNTQGHG